MVASTARITTPQSGDPLRSPSRGQLPLLLVVLATAVAYAAIVGLSVHPYGGNLSSMIFASQNGVKDYPGGLGHHIVVYRQASASYDGLSYYYVAGDPFLQRRAYRDAFRYQRIGYPLAVWATSLAQRAWRPAAMVGVNLAAVLAVAYLAGLIIRTFGEGRTSVWWALVCALNPSLIIAVQRDLGEPLMMALSLGGLLLYLRRLPGWAALTFAGALLTRDAAILFLLPVVAAEFTKGRWRQALALALAVVPYAIWALVVARALGHGASATTQSNFGPPFAGIAEVVGEMRRATPAHLLGWASILAVAALECVALTASIDGMRRRYDVVMGGIALHSVAAVLGSIAIWIGFPSAARVFGGLYPLAVFAFARHRGAAFGSIVGGVVALTVFTLFRYILHNPVLPYYLTP